jgi:hypothetical protein
LVGPVQPHFFSSRPFKANQLLLSDFKWMTLTFPFLILTGTIVMTVNEFTSGLVANASPKKL